jgi:Flp pilus assembly pilin Flp
LIAIRRSSSAIDRAAASSWRSFRSQADGSVAAEYGLIAALIVVGVILALTQVRANLLALPFPALIAAFGEALSS